MKIKSKIKDKEKDKFERLSKKFKVKFHKNMSIEELSAAWTLVPSEISSKYPQIGIALTTLGTIYTTVKSLRKAEVIAHEIYMQSKSALEDASAVMTQQYQVPITKLAVETAKATSVQIAEQMKQQAMALIDGVIPQELSNDNQEDLTVQK